MSKSALRVLEIMEFIAGQASGCTHTAIAQGLSIPKSSLTALLQDLQSKGYLLRHPETGAFNIGVQVLWLANSYLRNLNLARMGQPIVAELFTEVREFSVLAIPSGGEYVVICTESVPSIFGHSLQLGSRGPLQHSALGKAMLAFSPRAWVDEVVAGAGEAPTRLAAKARSGGLDSELEKTRRTGIGRSRGEAIAGVEGFAAPVFGAAGVPVAALGVGVPVSELSAASAAKIEDALRRLGRKLSMQLGWTGEIRGA